MGASPRPARLTFFLDAAATLYAAGLVACAHGSLMRPRAAMLQHWDEGYALAFARRMIEGGHGLPYVDAVSHRGVLFYWIVALAVKAYGFGTWMPVRTLALVSMLSALVLWFAAACVARRTLPGAVMSLGVFIVCAVGMQRPWEGVAGYGLSFNSEHLVNVFVGGALLSATWAFKADGSRPRLRWIGVSGACVMLAALSKQVAILEALPFGLWTLAAAVHRADLPRRRRGAMVLAFGVGLVVPLACVIIRYAVAGQLGTFYYYTITYNTRVYIPAVTPYDWNYYLHSVFNYHSDLLIVGACLAGWGVTRLFANVPDAFFRPARLPPLGDVAAAYLDNAFEITVALGFVLALAGASMGRRDFGHYYVPVVPWGCLLAGLLVDRALQVLPGRTRMGSARAVLVRALVLVPLALFATVAWRQSAAEHATRADVQALFETSEWPICKFLRERTKSSDSIFIWGFDPAPYTACDRRPASRFVFTTFVSGVVPWTESRRSAEATRVVPGSQEQLLDDLKRERPAFIFDSYETLRGRSMMHYHELRAFLLSEYCRDLADGPDVWALRPAAGCAVQMRPLVAFRRPEGQEDGDPAGSHHANSLVVASDQGIAAAVAAGYAKAEGQEGYVFDKPQPGTAALKLYRDKASGECLTVATPETESDAVDEGYELVGVEGYLFTAAQTGTVPLKRFGKAGLHDSVTTSSLDKESDALAAGYKLAGVEGYVTKW